MIKLDSIITPNKEYIVDFILQNDNSFSFRKNHIKFNIIFKNNIGIELIVIKDNLEKLIEFAYSLFEFYYSDMISDIFYFNTNDHYLNYRISYNNLDNNQIQFSIFEETNNEVKQRLSFYCDYDFLNLFLLSICNLIDNVYNLYDLFQG